VIQNAINISVSSGAERQLGEDGWMDPESKNMFFPLHTGCLTNKSGWPVSQSRIEPIKSQM